MKTITVFAGVVSMNPQEEAQAFELGRLIGSRGYKLLHGGYNGLMEAVAQGCKRNGGRVVAIGLAGVNWGPFNDYLDDIVIAESVGSRLEKFLNVDGIVAFAGGIGTLFEIAGSIHQFLTRPPKRVLFYGDRALRLLDFMHSDGWIFKKPTRDFSFIETAKSKSELEEWLKLI